MSIHTPASSQFNPEIYRTSSVRSIRAELRKLVTLRSTWIIFSLFLFFTTLGAVLIVTSGNAFTSSGKIRSEVITDSRQLCILLAVVFGALSITSEYSFGTIRSTVLAQPNRLKAFLSKFIAVTLFTAIATFCIFFLEIAITTLATQKAWEFGQGHGLALLYLCLLLALTSAMTMSAGYLIRSTAGTILTTFIFLNMASLLLLLPGNFAKETLPKFIPSIIIEATTKVSNGASSESIFPSFSPTISLLVWFSYTVVIAIFAFLRFKKSNV